MHIEFLLEEPSAEAALRHLVPEIIGTEHSARLMPHQGKHDLLQQLPALLRGYKRWVPADWRIVVLVDEDRQDCHRIKSDLERTASDAGLPTQSSPSSSGSVVVLNRLAIEEIEAWFFGDVDAIVAAYPRVPPTISARAPFRNPDAINGGTWEQLERTLQTAGYYRAGMPKIETADKIARHMVPSRNRSPSFRVFVEGLRSLVA